jgi:hypothetical protein
VVPEAVLTALERSNEAWLEHALANRLQFHCGHTSNSGGSSSAAATGDCHVVLLGVCFFAPLQQDPVARALEALPHAGHVLIEQPPPTAPSGDSGVLLPYPAWLQAVVDSSASTPTAPTTAAAAAGVGVNGALLQAQLAAAAAADPVTAAAQRLGRDILDPTESFGYYGALDFVRSPGAISRVQQLCGFVPGAELAAAAQHALSQGEVNTCGKVALEARALKPATFPCPQQRKQMRFCCVARTRRRAAELHRRPRQAAAGVGGRAAAELQAAAAAGAGGSLPTPAGL